MPFLVALTSEYITGELNSKLKETGFQLSIESPLFAHQIEKEIIPKLYERKYH